MIYLVRHGEAAAGWGDHPDPGLSETGVTQAEAVADWLVEQGARTAIASPMKRCRETAAPFERLAGVSADIIPAVSEIETPDHVTDRVAWLREVMAGEWPDELLGWCNSCYDAVAKLSEGTVVFSHFVAINAIVGQAQQDRRVRVFQPGHCFRDRVAARWKGRTERRVAGQGSGQPRALSKCIAVRLRLVYGRGLMRVWRNW